MTTGEKIRIRRKELGLTVDDLAAKVGKNRATIYRYESDAMEMPANVVKPLADALGTTPDDLMDWNSLLETQAKRSEKKMLEILPIISDGVSCEGTEQRYVLFKAPIRMEKLAPDLCAVLQSLYQINQNDQGKTMRTIRVLAELTASFDSKEQEMLLSYSEFLEMQRQEKLGTTVTHPCQRE